MMTYAVDTLVRGVAGERGRCRSGSEVLLQPRGRPHISLTRSTLQTPCPCRTSVSFGPRLASKIPHLCVFSTSWGSRRCPGPSTSRRRRWSSRPRSYHGPRKPPNMERMTRILINFVVTKTKRTSLVVDGRDRALSPILFPDVNQDDSGARPNISKTDTIAAPIVNTDPVRAPPSTAVQRLRSRGPTIR